MHYFKRILCIRKDDPTIALRNFNESEYVSFRRTDRQDMMAMVGRYLNLEITKMDGVRTLFTRPSCIANC